MSVEFFTNARTPACAAVMVLPVSAEAPHFTSPWLLTRAALRMPKLPARLLWRNRSHCGKKREGQLDTHCVTKRGGKWKESYIALLLLLLGTGTQDCQLFAPPWTFLIKEHFGKPRKISTDHTDIHHAESPRDQGMVTGPGLPKLKERLDNALRHRVILLGCLCKASWNP